MYSELPQRTRPGNPRGKKGFGRKSRRTCRDSFKSAGVLKNFCACQIALKLRPKLNETNNLRQINLYTGTHTHTHTYKQAQTVAQTGVC